MLRFDETKSRKRGEDILLKIVNIPKATEVIGRIEKYNFATEMVSEENRRAGRRVECETEKERQKILGAHSTRQGSK